MLSAEAISEFKEIWRNEFGEDISDEFALSQAVSLLSLYDKIYRPLNRLWAPNSVDVGVGN